ncbi:MFS transporter [Cloacibacterium normanense]|jgi:nucleoside transporter|uniref:MFS transporter n=1 Tax=Cloacibacterium normanense TaxID=237258 RepID=A0A2S7I3B3_9FLAO|nr:nucleoside permease [Cloacibacterium normanense]PPZ91057.1 MFS transporter [Cloacibacterium normanense]
MNIKFRLTLLSFLQFFVWGAWLTTLGTYGFGIKKWSGEEFGIVFMTLGIASIFMPAIIGMIADRWINAEKIYGILHILYGITLVFLAKTDNPTTFFWILLFAMFFYMPTISLSNSLSYTILKNNNYDVVKVFPPIRVWGTIGFIAAMWITNIFSDNLSPLNFGVEAGEKLASITGNIINANQFYIASFVAIILGIYSFTMPKCPPQNVNSNSSLFEKLGLNAFSLFKDYKMALFFAFSMLLGAALQLTNMYADTFLKDFKNIAEYANSTVVQYSTMIVSISQISETLFILTIPFFLKKFGIKKVMLMSMVAWVIRFGFFSFGSPDGFGLLLIILSNIVYGMAFDFFNISGSLFVETSTDSKIRSSAQGLFMMMTNGFGAISGSYLSGVIISKFFTDVAGVKDWHGIWLTFAIYALIITVLFGIMFKHKHNPEAIGNVSH